jgi:hypothetical protein
VVKATVESTEKDVQLARSMTDQCGSTKAAYIAINKLVRTDAATNPFPVIEFIVTSERNDVKGSRRRGDSNRVGDDDAVNRFGCPCGTV